MQKGLQHDAELEHELVHPYAPQARQRDGVRDLAQGQQDLALHQGHGGDDHLSRHRDAHPGEGCATLDVGEAPQEISKVCIERTGTAVGKPGRHGLPAHPSSHAGGAETGGQLVDDRLRDSVGERQPAGGAVAQHLGFGGPEVGEIGEGMELWSDERPAVRSLHR